MNRGNVKVLLVDDEEYLRKMYANELKHYVNFVVTAKNGEDALEKLEQEKDCDDY